MEQWIGGATEQVIGGNGSGSDARVRVARGAPEMRFRAPKTPRQDVAPHSDWAAERRSLGNRGGPLPRAVWWTRSRAG